MIGVNLVSTFAAGGVNAAIKALKGIAVSMGRIGVQTAAAAVAFKTLNSTVDFFVNSVNAARDLERNMTALKTVFGQNTGVMKDFISEAGNLGLSQNEAAKTSVYLGSVLKQAGFSMEEVQGNTQKLTVLAQDLATTFGYDTSEALTAMTALFRGEYDPIEKFGVALKQNEVNSLVAAKGLGHLTGQAKLNAEQQVRIEQLFKRSADAQGAFARGSGTLFVEQKKLAAQFADTQAVVGEALLPVMADFFALMRGSLVEVTPQLADAFQGIGVVMKALFPIFQVIIRIVGNLAGAFGALMDFLGPIINIFSGIFTVTLELLASLLENIGSVVEGVAQAFGDFFKGLDTNAQPGGVLGAIIKWIGDFIDKSVILRTVLKPVTDLLSKIVGRVLEIQSTTTAPLADETGRLIQRRLDRLGYGGVSNVRDSGTDAGGGGKAARNAVAEFFNQMDDEISKQSARMRLKNKGLSSELIESIIGSGEDWLTVFNRINKLTSDQLQTLQRNFNRTQTGMNAIKERLQKDYEAALDIYKEQVKVYEDQLALYEASVAALQELRKASSEAAVSVRPLARATRQIGEFEQATIDSFDAIRTLLEDGLANGTLTKVASDEITAYVLKEKEAIRALSAERDRLVAKRNFFETTIASIQSAIVGMARITEGTQQITELTTKMVGDIQVVISSTREGARSASELISNFDTILGRTKKFAEQLRQLRELGLDENLYKQIVEAGIDAGSATAEEIIKGGAGTVGELNTLFDELNSVGLRIAEESATYMFENGTTIISSLVEGMLAEEDALVSTAQILADSFITTFNSKMSALSVTMAMPTAPTAPTLQSVATSQIDALNAEIAASRAALKNLGKVTPGTADYKVARELMTGIRADLSAINELNQASAMSGASVPSSSQNQNVTIASTPVNLYLDNKVVATALIDYSRVNGSIVSKI